MFTPQYTITSKFLANIKRISEIVTTLNHRNYSHIIQLELERRARELSAFSSTSIEGNPLPLTEVKRLLKGNPVNVRDSEKEVLNYNLALSELDKRIKKGDAPFNVALLLQIQKTITRGLIEKHRNGKIRQEPVFVNNPKTGGTIYLPPDHQEVPVLLKDLISFTNANENKIDPLILAGVFHKQFVIIHPFIDGNGRTARLATKALLAKMGLDTFYLFSFENYYNQNVSRYFQEVGVTGDYYEMRDKVDFTSWLEYFTDGIIDELLRVMKDLEKANTLPVESLKEHHKLIISSIKKKGHITDKEYSSMTDRAKPTRNLDFKKLIDLGLIERIGKGRSTYYILR